MQKKHLQEISDGVSIKSIVSFFREKPNLIVFLLCLAVGAVYFYCAECVTKNIFAPTYFDYFNYLLDAFFHGRVNITSPNQFDLSLFEGKWYMYWGPAPALLILPFYLFSRLQASDVLYTAISGTVNVVLFYGVMQAFKKYFHLSLSLMAEAFLVLSFGLASPNFLLSVGGGVSFTEQIFATTYLLLFYLLYLRFLKSEKHWQLMLCAVFFCLACLSRYTLVFHGLLFLYLFVHYKRLGRAIPIRIILSLAVLALAFVSLEALYNFARFHDVLETGHRFQVGVPRFAAITKRNEMLSPRYFLYNIYYCFINVIHFSYNGVPVQIDLEGNSIFSAYPSLLLVPILLCTRKYGDKKRMSFLTIAGIVIGLNFLVLMLYLSTGWMQFGYRYFFDVLPLIFLLLMFILPSIPIFIQMGLLAYGLFVNFYGLMAFYGLSTDIPPLEETLFWIVVVLSLISYLSPERVEGT